MESPLPIADKEAVFAGLVQLLRFGSRLPLDEIRRVCLATGHDTWELIELLPDGAIPGDACCCGGRVIVVNSVPNGQQRLQYLGCNSCPRRFGKRAVPESSIRRRARRPKMLN
jgi:hypothetical protein